MINISNYRHVGPHHVLGSPGRNRDPDSSLSYIRTNRRMFRGLRGTGPVQGESW